MWSKNFEIWEYFQSWFNQLMEILENWHKNSSNKVFILLKVLLINHFDRASDNYSFKKSVSSMEHDAQYSVTIRLKDGNCDLESTVWFASNEDGY